MLILTSVVACFAPSPHHSIASLETHSLPLAGSIAEPQVHSQLRKLNSGASKDAEGVELQKAKLEDLVLVSDAAMALQVSAILKADWSEILKNHAVMDMQGVTLPAANKCAIVRRFCAKPCPS